MDMHKVQIFAKVFEQESFSRAGKALHLSQPTISAHVAALEQELGVALFDRIGRRITATLAGEVLYKHAQRIFAVTEEALSEIKTLQNQVSGHLSIGASTIPANYLLPEHLANFWRIYPEVVIDLHVGDSTEIITAICDNALTLGVVGARLPVPDLEYELVGQDLLALIMAPQVYAKYRRLTGVELVQALPWVLREEGSGTRRAMENSLASLGVRVRDLKTTITVRSAAAVASCIQAGMGASITSTLTVASSLADGTLVAVDLPELCTQRSFYVVYNTRRSFFSASSALIGYLRSVKNLVKFPAEAGGGLLNPICSKEM